MKTTVMKTFVLITIATTLLLGFNNCGKHGFFPNTADSISPIGSKGVETGNPMTGVALPKVFIDSSYPQLRPDRKIITVGRTKRHFTDCQSAVDAAKPGDEIVIDAGYVCKNLVLTDKGDASEYIVIRTAGLSSLPPEGKRITREHAPHLAVLETDSYQFALGVEDVPTGSKATISPNHYYLIGLEIRVNPKAKVKNGYIVKFRKSSSDLKDLPHDIILARSWIHGNPDQEVRTGIELNGLRISIVDSIIEEIHLHDETSEGIAAWDAAVGPYKITNNEIAVAGIGILIGWQSSIPGLIPSDIEVRGNYFHKLDAWRTPVTSNLGLEGHWFFGNPIVLRSAQRVLFDANIFTNDWSRIPETSNYLGHVFWLKPNGFGQPWARVQDITITNNVMHDVGGGFGIFYQDPGLPEVVTQRVHIENNIAYNLDAKNNAGFIWLQGQASGAVTFHHNTFLSKANSLPALLLSDKDGRFEQFRFTNNLIFDNGAGIPGLTAQFPMVNFNNNVLAGQQATRYGEWALGNYFPATLYDIGFIGDPSSVPTTFLDLELSPASPFYRAGSEGRDIGADVKQVERLLSK